MRDGLSGGIQQWVIGLASALSKLEDGPEDYLFLVDEGHDAWLTPYLGGRCRLLVQPARTLGDPDAGSLSPLHQTISAAGADVMHFTRQTAFATTVPSIYQPWDLQHIHLPEFFSPADRGYRESAYRAFCAQASLIVVATKWVKADVARQFAIPQERIAVVNPAPVTDAYRPPTAAEEHDIAARLGLPSRYVFYPAQAWGHKNHQRLFEALRLLRDRGVIVPLVCTGHENAGYATVLRRAEELGVQAQVTFLGFVDTTEIQVVYRRATALVFPSLYEGWGLPILEAFAAGLAVACSNVTSLPELVGDAAIVFDPLDPEAIASAVDRIWDGDELRAALVQRGRARASEFDWTRTALIMRAHYRKMAGLHLESADRDLIATDPLV
jgi:glycosyltransferase involved in cell wall biosynthesis